MKRSWATSADALVEGVPLPCPSGSDRLSDEVPGDAQSEEVGPAEAAPRVARVELHHLATWRIEKTLKLILDSGLSGDGHDLRPAVRAQERARINIPISHGLGDSPVVP